MWFESFHHRSDYISFLQTLIEGNFAAEAISPVAPKLSVSPTTFKFYAFQSPHYHSLFVLLF
jgi:hypothetical protein